ncbi:hypothetical protein [Arthrobacter sp. MA-N2]|uniref:hypothetical protein n=1 Tax=Arthrobacter sp. MA-N2 TaxID=1101188 RepID=UPI000487F595|nr:hypothetical protein [Arthrobacter sp. MA-N2]
MATFAAHVFVHGESGPVHFAPGDELPEWAEGLVGKHCLEPEAVDEVPVFTAPNVPPAGDEEGNGSDSEGAGDNDQDGEGEGDDDTDESDDVDPAATADAPDFTAPAPRRGRPRKA